MPSFLLNLSRPPAERSTLTEVFQTVIVTLHRPLACRYPELIEQPPVKVGYGAGRAVPNATLSDREGWKCVIPDLPGPDVRMH
jgi:hypothetical protein